MIARGSRYSIAHQCLDDPKCRNHVISAVGHQIKTEIQTLCSKNVDSVQRKKDAMSLKTFTWAPILNEAKKHAPTLVKLLRTATSIGSGKNKRVELKQDILIGACVSIICKYRNPRMALFQRVVSLVLYSGHSGKKVNDHWDSTCSLLYLDCTRKFNMIIMYELDNVVAITVLCLNNCTPS